MEQPAALAGIRVLDLTTELGVYATKLLADLGADVIRVEPPDGDPLRSRQPIWGHENPISLYYAYTNTSKRVVTLDPSLPEGRALLLKLAATAHVIVETVTQKAPARWGITEEELTRISPALVYVRITPFGEDGPWAEYAGNDLVLMATGGLLWLAGEPDGPPLVAAGEQAYIMAGLNAATAALVALYHAELTGEGQTVSVSAQECVAASLENAIQFYDLERTIRKRGGAKPKETATGLFPCTDGYIYLMAGRLSTPRGWVALVEWLNEERVPGAGELARPEWSEHRYRATREATVYFDQIFSAFSATRSKHDIYEEGQRRGIICAPVSLPADLPNDPQLKHRQYFVPVVHPELGAELIYPGPPYRLSATPWQVRRRAPLPGEDNGQVYGELGLAAADLQALAAKGVI